MVVEEVGYGREVKESNIRRRTLALRGAKGITRAMECETENIIGAATLRDELLDTMSGTAKCWLRRPSGDVSGHRMGPFYVERYRKVRVCSAQQGTALVGK